MFFIPAFLSEASTARLPSWLVVLAVRFPQLRSQRDTWPCRRDPVLKPKTVVCSQCSTQCWDLLQTAHSSRQTEYKRESVTVSCTGQSKVRLILSWWLWSDKYWAVKSAWLKSLHWLFISIGKKSSTLFCRRHCTRVAWADLDFWTHGKNSQTDLLTSSTIIFATARWWFLAAKCSAVWPSSVVPLTRLGECWRNIFTALKNQDEKKG